MSDERRALIRQILADLDINEEIEEAQREEQE